MNDLLHSYGFETKQLPTKHNYQPNTTTNQTTIINLLGNNYNQTTTDVPAKQLGTKQVLPTKQPTNYYQTHNYQPNNYHQLLTGEQLQPDNYICTNQTTKNN